MIFTSDFHLGLETDSVNVDGIPSKVSDSIIRIREIIDYAAKTNQSVIVAGDVNETVDPKSYVHAALVDILNYAIFCKVFMYIIPGNHDCDISWNSLLVGKSAVTSNRQDVYINIITEPSVGTVESATICFIPHVPRGTIESFESYLSKVKEVICQKASIVVSHALAQGALNISDTVLSESNNALSFNEEAFPKSSLYILGHVHNYQVLQKKNCKVVYPGSIIMNDFGERHDKKGFVEVDSKLNIKFIPFKSKVHDYVQVNLSLMDKDRLQLSDAKLLKLKDKIIKIVVNTDDYGKVDELYIKGKFSKYCHVVRFEVNCTKASITTKSVESESVLPTNLSHNKLLKKWLDGQKEESEIVRQLAYKIGKEISEEN